MVTNLSHHTVDTNQVDMSSRSHHNAYDKYQNSETRGFQTCKKGLLVVRIALLREKIPIMFLEWGEVTLVLAIVVNPNLAF
jgi:hypothetical protein